MPPHELKDDEKKLEGFAWRIEERPTQKDIMIGPLEAERQRLEEERIYQEELGLPRPEQVPDLQDITDVEKAKEAIQNPENQELRQ
jgi:thiamine pyrophosphokinase